MKIKLARLNNVQVLCGQCETRICSITDVGKIDDFGILREINMYNTTLKRLEYNKQDYFCNYSTYEDYVEGVERYQLYGCLFGHVIAFRFLPNKFTDEMEKSGYYNKLHLTIFSNLLL